ncbi:outer membrane autotransporter barrel domain-containing protein [Bartonella quintana JK 19]|uniref:autotransporter outer membrane beta-barrel domain-containing protein n=1 Tax=Bartonella quintana TaxID=803 RepID=UPI0004A092A3|nr:autotransporter outer membrane beta-barrel domain-containing protein [Bartonella quintana]KEC57622.1 outer membrane autotransporter barrel domain-containing protein [Bartonella quintana JK 19]
MINVFKNRTHLCALTTSILFFLQGVDISMGSAVSAVSPSYECKAASNSKDSEINPVMCDSGTTEITGGTITVKKYDGYAVHADGGQAVINVKNLSINFEPELISSANPSNGLAEDVLDRVSFEIFGGAVFSDGSYESGTKVNLQNSSIDGFFYGLKSESYGKISMEDGFITDTYIGGVASSESSIVLKKVDIEFTGIGLVSNNKSSIMMQSGSINFNGYGVGVMSTDMGFVLLDGVDIAMSSRLTKFSQEGGEGGKVDHSDGKIDYSIEPERYVLLSGGGAIAFNNGNINVLDAAVLLVDKNSQDTLGRNIEGDLAFLVDERGESEVNGLKDRVPREGRENGVYHIISHSAESGGFFNDIDSVILGDIASFERDVAEVLKAANHERSRSALNLSASFKSSAVKVNGKKSYGIYFRGAGLGNVLNPVQEIGGSGNGNGNGDSVNSGSVRENIDSREGGINAVLLKSSRLRVPKGIAIYGEDFGGYVIVKDESTLLGGLLLKAEAGSDLSVFVHDSVIAGAARVDEDSHAKLFLSGGSEWYLTEDVSSDFRDPNAGCVDSCISSMRLVNSNIRFLLSSEREGDQKGRNNKYRTLHIGDGKGIVYSAHGTSKIYFNAGLISGDAGSTQVSDRLLIHGDVSGRTLVHVDLVSDSTSSGDQNQPSSVSIIQVYGSAEGESFKLDSEYVTLNSPYRYTLRAYGPNSHQGSSSGSASKFFDPELRKESEQFWDYRLENQFVVVAPASARSEGILTVSDVSGIVPGVSETSRLGTLQSSSLARSEGGSNIDTPILSNSLDSEGLDSSENSESLVESREASGILATSNVVKYIGPDGTFILPVLSNGKVVTPDGRLIKPGGRVISHNGKAILEEYSETPSGESIVTSEDSSSKAPGTVPIVTQSSGPRGRILLTTPTSAGSETSPVTPSITSLVQPVLSAASQTSSVTKGPDVSTLADVGGRAVSATCNYTGSIGGVRGDVTGSEHASYSCSDGQSHTISGAKLEVSDSSQHSVSVGGKTTLNMENVTIIGTVSSDSGNHDSGNQMSAVLAEKDAGIVLNKKSTIQASHIGLEAQSGGKVKMTDGTINADYAGVFVGAGSSIQLDTTNISMKPRAVAGLASNGGEITMSSGTITLTDGIAVRSELGGNVKLDKVNITAKKGQIESASTEVPARAAFLLKDRGSVDFTNGNVITDATGLWFMDVHGSVETGASRRRRSSDVAPSMNRAYIESSSIKVEGDSSYGIYFNGVARVDERNQNRISEEIVSESARRPVNGSSVFSPEKTLVSITGTALLKKTNFEVPKSVAIYGSNSGGLVSVEKKTFLSGDLLLKSENNSNILVLVDDSVIAGGARVDESSTAKLRLTNNSKWSLLRPKHEKLQDFGSLGDSSISALHLVNSSVSFEKPESNTADGYQTLRIGKGVGAVYNAQGNAHIYFNARLNPSDPSNTQVTDRLLIHGDVSGKTVVHVKGVSGSVGENNRSDKIAHSVSIIQVYGKAEKDSFQLSGDYVALDDSPYKYTLRSYAPKATSTRDDVDEKFMKDGGEFWNFRLENQYVELSDSAYTSTVSKDRSPGQAVRSVVPQVPTYLLLPNGLFHAGLVNISNQNKHLERLRATSGGMSGIHENPALFLRGYAGHYRYSSNLSALEYGYGGELGYNALEAGVLLKTIENAYSNTFFGVIGAYERLSLQPLAVEQSQKSAFDKWSVTAYGTMQYDTGFYVDGLLSYGLFKGDVLTLARGKTATLKGNPLSVSLTGGQPFATGYEGFVFDPQVQVVYQHLRINPARDIDNFEIELGKLDQWTMRVGGRLTKTFPVTDEARLVSFYSKFYLAHGFDGKQSVHFKDAFQLGAFGSSLEAGLGFNARLSSKFALHGDLVYQHKLSKAGFSGTSFVGGLRYQF